MSRKDLGSSEDLGVSLDNVPASNESLLATSTLDRLHMSKYKALTRWLALCGIVGWTDDLGDVKLFKKTPTQKVLPFIIPIVFVVATVLQDLTCYKYSGCQNHPLFDNITYNSTTVYGWLGLLIAASALHANVLTFARSGKLASLFSCVPSNLHYDSRVKRTVGAWVAGWVILVALSLGSSISFIVIQVTQKGCTAQHLVCIIPQSIQIVSGLSMVVTGVGLSYLVSLLVRLDILNTQEQCSAFINESDLRTQLQEFVNLKARIKQLGKDTQVGNAIAFCGGCACIFGSLWAFTEEYRDDAFQTPIIFSLSLWMCLVSLLLTFLAVFSFSNVTQSCDDFMESIRDNMSKYVIKKETTTITLGECLVMISSHQQRFGFEIMGILVEPEIVRAGAYAGVTAAAAILKLAIA